MTGKPDNTQLLGDSHRKGRYLEGKKEMFQEQLGRECMVKRSSDGFIFFL
jgi:hypothetical protein